MVFVHFPLPIFQILRLKIRGSGVVVARLAFIFYTVAISAPPSSISDANVRYRMKEKPISCRYL